MPRLTYCHDLLVTLSIGTVTQMMSFSPCTTLFSPYQHRNLGMVPVHLHIVYEQYFHLADKGFYNGRVMVSTKNWNIQWADWVQFCTPVGSDPYLQRVQDEHKVQILSGFSACVQRQLWLKTAGCKSDSIYVIHSCSSDDHPGHRETPHKGSRFR